MSKTLIVGLRRICIVFSFALLMGPTFIMEAVANSYPVDLSRNTQETSVMVNVYKPVDAVNGIMTLSTYDADHKSEGELVINGNTPIALFGSSGVKGNNKRLADITISTPASHWNDGDNTLLFKHTKTAGYSINGVAVLFDASSTPGPEPAAVLSVDNINFGSLDVGGASDPSPLTLTNSGGATLNISDISISSGFTEANNCNTQVPAGGGCVLDIQFMPVTSGTINGTLTIIGDDAVGTHTVSLTGSGSDGTQDPPIDSGNPAGNLLYVDFSNQAIGSYAVDNIKSDFQVNLNGYNDYEAGMMYGLEVVADPAASGRGNVMRVKRVAGKGGNGTSSGGMSFRADFTPQEDVYLAYDMYVATDHEWTLGQKNPGLMTGTMLEASHAHGVNPDPEGITAFSARITSDNTDAWPARGDGAMSIYYYDADVTQRNNFWNTEDPTLDTVDNQYNQPQGYWITVEERIKMNTVTEEGISSLKDGLAEVWVTDPQRWDGARKVSSHSHRWRYTETMKIDGLWMVNYYGGDASDPVNQPAQDQYHYYDNFIVSTSPITH